MSKHILIKLVEAYAPETVRKTVRTIEDLRQVERDARTQREIHERELLESAGGAGAFAH